MGKKLYIIRHAKSSWKDMSLSDFDRPLNKRGKSDAPLMGERLHKYHVQPDLILSSPANRAQKTARLIAKEVDYDKSAIREDKRIYLAEVSQLLQVLYEQDDQIDNLFLIGHNPGLTLLAEYFSGLPVQNIPTCGIFCVEFQVNSWKKIEEKRGSLVFFDFPKKHHS